MPGWPTWDRRHLAAWSAAALGALVIILSFTPGIAMDEAVGQLERARQADYDDNAALFAFFWRWLDGIVPGTFGPLVFQIAFFWSALALVALKAARHPAAIFCIVLGLGLFPTNLYMLPFVLKDTSMIAASLLAFALLWHARDSGELGLAVAALLLLLYAQSIRHNGPAATAPLVFWSATIFAERLHWPARSLRAILLGLGLCGIISLTSFGINHRLQPGTTAQYQITLVFDLATLSLQKQRSFLPSSLSQDSPESQLQNLRALYVENEGQTLFFDPTNERPDGRVLPILPGEGPEIRQLRARWLRTVTRFPGTWIRHRLHLFGSLLASFYFPERPDTAPNQIGLAFHKTSWNGRLQSILVWFEGTFLFRGWPYFLAILIVLGWATWRWNPATSEAVVALSASALLFELSFMPAAFTIVFKYNWWMICCALVLVAIVIPRRFRTRP